jgi:O-acetyl-ADP-ribose deacetylase (regulator of RNase III)
MRAGREVYGDRPGDGSKVKVDTLPSAGAALMASLRERIDGRIETVQADLTTLALDAIVNAANSSLLGGAGVDGAIHRGAGPELGVYCRGLGGCKTGQAKITPGFKLPAAHVIHTVGPVWQNGRANEEALLASCYRTSLAVAVENGIRTLAFPAISTGIYRFPADLAAKIAVRTVVEVVADEPELDKVVFCCFDAASLDRHVKALEALDG